MQGVLQAEPFRAAAARISNGPLSRRITVMGRPAEPRLSRVLFNDPAMGVMRHADAGYEDALACAREHHLHLPAITG